MAQSTPNVADCIPAGLRLLEHRPIKGGSGREEACAPLSGPQAKISRLWDFADFDNVAQAVPLNVVGPTPNRGGDQGEAAEGALSADARTGPTGVIEVEPSGYLRPADDLTETDMGNLNAVLDHEIARNTMKNYRVQWNNFIMWAVGRGIRVLPADPGQVAAYLAERIEEHGHKPATLRAAAAALAFVHRTAGQDDPCSSPEVKRTLRSATRKAGRDQKQAEALTAEALDAIQSTARKPRRGRGGRFETQETARCRGNMDIALISLMRDGMLRVSEAAVLTWRDHRNRGRRDGTPSDPALQDGLRGRGSRCLPICPDDGGSKVDMWCEGGYGQCVRAASKPGRAAHQASRAGGRVGGRLQRSLAACRHGTGPGEGWNRAAKADERRSLAYPLDAGALYPQ